MTNLICKDCETEIRPENDEEIMECSFCGSTDLTKTEGTGAVQLSLFDPIVKARNKFPSLFKQQPTYRINNFHRAMQRFQGQAYGYHTL